MTARAPTTSSSSPPSSTGISLSPVLFSVRRARVRALLRTSLGVLLMVHGVAHAVLPARGAGALEATSAARTGMNALWTVALLGFVAGGLGVAGARSFRRTVRLCVHGAAAASVLAIMFFGQGELFLGILLDMLAVVAVEYVRGPGVTARRPRLSARIANAVAFALVGYLFVAAVSRPWHRRWGTTAEEIVRSLPGDVPQRDPAFEVMHAITVAAPAERVWPWLVQMGQDRGGFYSYSVLENLFFLDIDNADEIHPEWQDRKEGDFVRAAPRAWLFGLAGDEVGWRVDLVEPNRALVLQHWGAFVLDPQKDGTTRLIVRSKMNDPAEPVWAAALTYVTLEIPHFIMEEKMLRGIRDRAERSR